MKTGKSLMELAAEIDRQSKVKKDYQLDTRMLQMQPQEAGLVLAMQDSGIVPLTVNDIAHRQIGTHLGIPAKYYDKMRGDAPELLAHNVNAWFQQEPSTRKLRTLDGTARAFLSDRYRRLDNLEVLEAALPIIQEMPGIRVESCEITERRMYIKVVNPRLETEVVPGDIVQAGLIISNSETGNGSVSVSPLVYRLVCSNGMVVNDAATRKYHIGRGNEIGENYEVYSNATLEADDRAFAMKIQDTVRAAVDIAKFEKVVDRMREARGIRIVRGTDIPAIVELTAREFSMTKEESSGILQHLIEGGDLSLYGLSNAVTRQSQDVESYDRATDLETAGYSILTMNPRLWTRINNEAAV